jgi:hypothetical protein
MNKNFKNNRNSISMFALEDLYDNKSYKSFLLKVLDELKTYPPENEDRIYVGGTVDSNQSFAERQYTTGVLGVIASSEKVGYALVMILGMIIDNNYSYVLTMLEEYDERTLDQIIKFMSSDPESCNGEHSLTEKSRIELCGGKHQVVNPRKMNLWTLERIRKYVADEEDFGF